VAPLLHEKGEDGTIWERMGVRPVQLLEDEATAKNLSELLSDPLRKPAFLFTASHGAEYGSGDPEQSARQGNLVCQTWKGGSTRNHEFGATDIPTLGLKGAVVFSFACHSAGTPRFDSIFRDKQTLEPQQLAPSAFVSSLAQAALLQGAIGFLGHVDLALGKTLVNPRGERQGLPFENLVLKLLDGKPIGLALEDMNQRYAAKSAEKVTLDEQKLRADVPAREIVDAWLGRNDAGGYILLGDPAARLRLKSR